MEALCDLSPDLCTKTHCVGRKYIPSFHRCLLVQVQKDQEATQESGPGLWSHETFLLAFRVGLPWGRSQVASSVGLYLGLPHRWSSGPVENLGPRPSPAPHPYLRREKDSHCP